MMDKGYYFLSFFCSFVVMRSQAQLVPALYIFGDSYLDSGNFNGSCYSLPYGIGLPGGKSERLTDGYTIADFFAQLLGLKHLPVPRVKVTNDKIVEGINFACRAAGILNETGGYIRRLWSLGEQVQQFAKTVKEYLPKIFTTNATLSAHLAKSILIVHAGGNDYATNYFLPQNFKSQSPQQFADTLVTHFAIHLQDLYQLGGRKFVVTDVEPIGCVPYARWRNKQQSTCVENLNSVIKIYNDKLEAKLKDLGSKLKGSAFVLVKLFDLLSDMANHPANYGLRDSRNPCCECGENGTCKAGKAPCSNRNQHLFFDALHPSEATCKTIASRCFNGKGVCVPMNVQQLTQI